VRGTERQGREGPRERGMQAHTDTQDKGGERALTVMVGGGVAVVERWWLCGCRGKGGRGTRNA
jgi:hypothetical protein